jgi:hypothetical protein
MKAADADLARLREDSRWESLVNPADSGIASLEVEGYLSKPNLKGLSDDFLLLPSADEGNVIVHLLPAGQQAYPDSRLLLAADLAEHRRPREERRAAELLREVSDAVR